MRPIFEVMVLSLVRDRGMLAMSFILPPLIFAIFAAVFSGAGGGDLRIKVVVADLAASPASARAIDQLSKAAAIEPIGPAGQTEASVEDMVRRGRADVGLLVRSDPRTTFAFTVVEDPARKIASSVLIGQLQAALRALAPDNPAAPAIATRPIITGSTGSGTIAYYAGAVAILFLLFAAVQGAVTLHEDRESGILDRIVTGPLGIGALVTGKFAFIVALGTAQVAVLFVVAWLLYGVDLPSNIVPWLVTTVTAAVAAGGLTLLLASLCNSRRQMLTLGNFLALILSAVGGSMIPRFLMPDWLQSAGWATPNAWALDAYTGVFWRGDSWGELVPAWAVLLAVGAVSLALARLFARRFETI